MSSAQQLLDAAGRRRSPGDDAGVSRRQGAVAGVAHDRDDLVDRGRVSRVALTLVPSEGIPLPLIQRQLGHSHLSTTGTYLQGISSGRSSPPSTPATRR